MATILPCLSSDPRPVVRCDRCQRVQFFTANGRCRVCKELFFPEPKQPSPPPVTQEAESKLDRYHVAGHIREIRELRGLSQRGLAERMGAPRTYISKIEGGKCLPTLYGAGLGWGEPDPRAGALRRGVGRWVGRDCGACTWRGALGANRADSRGRARRGGGRGLTLTESRLRASHKTFPPAPTRVRNHITPNGDACYCRD